MDSGTSIKQLKVDGGATVNNLMMQFQADMLQTEVARPRIVEITALGVEYAAGLAIGEYKVRPWLRPNIHLTMFLFCLLSSPMLLSYMCS